MRGRKPKPLSAQIAAGDPSRIGKQKLERLLAGQPKAAKGLPTCPKHLRGRAHDAWIFWAQQLALMDIDRKPDAHMLEGACVAYEAAVASYETVLEQGPVFEKKALNPKTNKLVVVDLKPHPAVRQGNQAWALMKLFCCDFGLSPISRLKLAIEEQDAGEADLLELLGRPRVKTPTLPIQ